MQLFKIETGNFMADGGAVFGVVPKVMWQKKYPANADNYVNLTMRCLLIKTNNKIVLIDTGLGDKQSDKFFSYHHLNGDDSLYKSLKAINVSYDQVTDVILTHLHFDHCGGAVQKGADGNLLPTFANARYWLSEAQWENFNNPNVREGSVYFKENILPIREAGLLNLIKEDGWLSPQIEMRIFNGHTKGQIIPIIKYHDKTIVYTADLFPVMASIPEAWVAAYDVDPVGSMNEKRAFLKEAVENNYILFFEHDLYNECCTLVQTEKGIQAGERFKLEMVL
ncbi:Glyoxylase, beta-lactamase superfamily II [Saccharicrinis carchari]|uniref:Glyoxylase, beta-lactamase superfamily II n=1 Tax=Saccharicrinis carchari TaxID=1168039 RepID=A0A521BUQ7_SACCC|nr:MBL fold metallo-hydrolase [Saccharicrinis carchari]SMO50888.1 Glyoxylase, beta-lactamase superfamily II [Saccharicrinis carchari]